MTNEDKWIKIWEAPNTPVFHLYGDISAIEHQKKMFGYETSAILRLIKKEVAEAYHTSKDLEVCATSGYKYYEDPKRFKEHIAKSTKILEQFPHITASFTTKFSRCTDLEDCLLLLEEINVEQALIFAYFNSTNRQFTGKIEQDLTEVLTKNYPEKGTELLEILTRPNSLSTFQREKIDFYTIILKYLPKISRLRHIVSAMLEDETPELLADLNEQIKKYSFLSGHEGTDVWDLPFYIDHMRTIIANDVDIQDERKRLLEYENNTEEIKEKTINSNTISPDISYLAEILSELAHFRLEFRIVWSSYYHLQKKIIYEISKILEIPVQNLTALTPDFLIRSVRDKTIRNLDLQARYNAHLFVVVNNQITFSISGDKAESRMKREIPVSRNLKTRKLHGTPVFQGEVEGTAFCFDWSDPHINKKMYEMKEGDIIVIGNTKPSLMPAIQKASAIITDEGGLVCHAAIVSRELQKPCIIGTREATKIIQTGMKLRVDAVKGEIEILSNDTK